MDTELKVLADKFFNINQSWRTQENANGGGKSAPAEMASMANMGAAANALINVYPAYVTEAYQSGYIHLHDLGFPGAYCAGWDLTDLLRRGFGHVPGYQTSKPAQHLRSALGQIVNFVYTLSGEWAGAMAFSNFDTLLAPYARGMHYLDIKQCMQEFIFNVNVPTRLGMQTPFLNLTFDLQPPSHLKDNLVMWGGEYHKRNVYSEYQMEMDLLNQAFCEVMTAGDAHGRVFTFPIPTYNITPGFDWSDHEAIWDMTAKYGLPYFANYVNSDIKPEDAISMCCRLKLDISQMQRRVGGRFASAPLTGSVGVVTLNLPLLAYEAHGDLAKFIESVKRMCDVARDALEAKRAWVEARFDAGLYPFSRVYLEEMHAANGEWLTYHFCTIGVIGGAEALLNLNVPGIESNIGIELMQHTLEVIKQKTVDFQALTSHYYNLEATPGEGASYRLAKHDLEKYPDIITAGTPDAPYYTNSTQLPVNLVYNLGDAAQHQNELQPIYTGGTVHHIYLGQSCDADIARDIIKTVINTTRLPYLSLTPTFSVCTEHKYLIGEHHACPHCGKPCEVYSRVVGYLRPVRKWNRGKQQEFAEREVFATE
jgi:ribonucleoside-triphosphate reductase (formate)